MDEDQIIAVAKVLEEWNPLGERAGHIEDLDGYYTEAIDIISAIKLHQGKELCKWATKTVLDQAFDLSLSGPELEEAAKKIKAILS